MQTRPFLTLLTAALLLLLPTISHAGNIVFNIKSSYQYKVQVEFYSQRYNRAWPGSGKAYNINDWDTHSYSLNCESGEQICYGAWATGNSNIYWGVGMNDSHTCSNCCAVCDGGTVPTITLSN